MNKIGRKADRAVSELCAASYGRLLLLLTLAGPLLYALQLLALVL